jgi:Methylamine utilisation protein MauE
LSFAAGPFFASAGILVVSGVAKVRSPRPAAESLFANGVPVGAWMVRLLAVAEIVLGLAAILRPRPAVAFAVAGAYVLFAVAASLFLWSPRVRSCGCMGDRAVPPSVLHVVMNLAAAAFAAAAALTGVDSLPSVVATLGWGAPLLVAGSAAVAYLAASAVSLFPAAYGAYAGEHDHHREHGGGTSVARLRRTEDVLHDAGVEAGHPSLWGALRPETTG